MIMLTNDETNFLYIEGRFNVMILNRYLRHEQNFNNMLWLNQISVASISYLKPTIQDMLTRVDYVTSLV